MIKVEEVKSNTYSYWVIYVNDEEWIRFCESMIRKNRWIYFSNKMNIEDDYIESETLEEVIEEFKEIICSYCYEIISKYESIVELIEYGE